jgi:putative glycosyltransferase
VQYEFVFVNDGSPDDSAEVVRGLMAREPHIKLVDLSRNYGQYPAMFAGMAYATGTYICTLDADLEEAPENLTTMFEMITADRSIEVVYSIVQQRTGGISRTLFGNIFFKVLGFLSEVHIPPNQGWQRVMSKRYVEALLNYREAETLPAGLMALTGFKQVPLTIEKPYKGSTSYSIRKRLTLALNSITAFSSKPLVLVGLMGMIISMFAFFVILYIRANKIFFVSYQAGWISILASIWLVGGLVLASLGLVGVYLAKIFNQVKNRPLYNVRSVERSDMLNK